MFASTSTSTINVFDFDAIRLPPDFEREGGVRRQLTQVKVRKPRAQEWIRVNPDPAYCARVATVVYKDGDEFEGRSLSGRPGRRADAGR